MQQRKFFSSTERTFSPKQQQNNLKKDVNLRLFKKDAKVGGSSLFYWTILDFSFKFHHKNDPKVSGSDVFASVEENCIIFSV